MPTPKKNESKDKYISRCVSHRQGKEGKNEKRDKSVAICASMWQNRKGKK